MASKDSEEAERLISELWNSLGRTTDFSNRLSLLGGDPYPSSFRIGLAAQLSMSLSALMVSDIYSARTGEEPPMISVDTRLACLEFHSEAYTSVDGKVVRSAWDSIAGLYPTKDGFIRLHTNFPHHREAVLDVLNLHDDATSKEVQNNLSSMNSEDIAQKITDAGGCATSLRSHETWLKHPQAKAISELPGPVFVQKMTENHPVKWPVANELMENKALSGIKVLDLTRVIAGPVAGRTLAAYGADVLLVNSPNLPSLPGLDVDTSRGKRSIFLDLNRKSSSSKQDRAKFVELLRSADVLLQGYRPDGLNNLGFSPEEVRQINPNIIYASLSAWGREGVWRERRGFDSLVQTATGFNVDEGDSWEKYNQTGEAGLQKPKRLPVQALDHASGYFLSAGIQDALYRRSIEGGSWEVHVALAQTGKWIRQLGRKNSWDKTQPTHEDAKNQHYIKSLIRDDASQLRYIAHAIKFNSREVSWDRAPSRLGVDEAVWLE